VIDRILGALSSARGRRIKTLAAFWAIPITLVLWVLSALTWASSEPQFVLGLSWLAITLTAIDILTSAQIHEENGDSDGDESSSGDAESS
jgi:hypothetical protein